MSPLPRRGRWFFALVLGSLLALPSAASAATLLVDAVVGQVGSAVVAASDIALARALELFGFTRSANAIDSADVDRYAAALSEVFEADRLGLGPSASEIDQAWTALEARLGGTGALQAWLDATAIDRAWARRAVEADLRWRAWAEFHAAFSGEWAVPTDKPRTFLAPSQTVALPFPMPR